MGLPRQLYHSSAQTTTPWQCPDNRRLAETEGEGEGRRGGNQSERVGGQNNHGFKPPPHKEGEMRTRARCDENLKAANSASNSDNRGWETGKLDLGGRSWDLKSLEIQYWGAMSLFI